MACDPGNVGPTAAALTNRNRSVSVREAQRELHEPRLILLRVTSVAARSGRRGRDPGVWYPAARSQSLRHSAACGRVVIPPSPV